MSKFLQISITPEMLENTLRRDRAAGKAFKGASIKGGKGRFYGFLGEEIVHGILKGSILDPTKDYDIVFRNKKWDVKTKVRKDPPKEWYDATVDDSAAHQENDFYIFVSILGPHLLTDKTIEEIRSFNYKTAWITGFISKHDFYANAIHFNSGDTDPSNGLRYRENTNLLKYSKLLDINRLLRAIENE